MSTPQPPATEAHPTRSASAMLNFPRTALLFRGNDGANGYSTPRPNLLDFGNPFGGRRPASARVPRHSASSFVVAANSRPAESFQVNPPPQPNPPTSAHPPSRHFSNRTPPPR